MAEPWDLTPAQREQIRAAHAAQKVAALRQVFDKHLRAGRRSRRHPAEVTSDRLGDALDRWPEYFDGPDRDAIAQIRSRLEAIASGDEDK